MADDALPLITFADAAGLESWLEAHGESSSGAWLRFTKRGAPEPTITKSDAIDCALAFGWVDGQLGRVEDALKALIAQKTAGRLPVGEAPPIEDTNVIDLMAVLRASLTRGAALPAEKAKPGTMKPARKPAAKAAPVEDAKPAKRTRKAG